MSENGLDPKSVVQIYSEILADMDVDAVATLKSPISLPTYSEDEIQSLCREIKEVFAKEPVCLELSGPINIVGDLHGHILDLFRVLKTFGFPDECTEKYLFLGDIVDRGEFSLETVTLVFSLKLAYPEKVYIIRGNHEFEFLNERCGFMEDVTKAFGQQSDLYSYFKAAFSYMPITAVIGNEIICVHGGLGPNWFSINQARKIERPIDDFGDDLLDAMLWSDPSDNIDFFEPSNRGTGFFFGKEVVADFLNSNSLKLLVRAHECVNNGIEFMFNDKLATVFGASNYCGLVANYSGVLMVKEDCSYEVKTFPALQYLKRETATFMKVVDGKLVALPQARSQKTVGRGGGFTRPSMPKLPPIGGTGRSFSTIHRPQQPSTARAFAPRNHFHVPR